MISELGFIRSYNTFWKSLFPGGDDYIRLINSSLGEKFETALEFNDIPNRRALINNVAFSIFERYYEKEIDIKQIHEISSENQTLIDIIKRENKALSNFKFGSKIINNINQQELNVVKSISKRLITQYSKKTNL